MEDLKKGWKEFAVKDRVQSFIIIMVLFTVLYLVGSVPVELYEKVSGNRHGPVKKRGLII